MVLKHHYYCATMVTALLDPQAALTEMMLESTVLLVSTTQYHYWYKCYNGGDVLKMAELSKLLLHAE